MSTPLRRQALKFFAAMLLAVGAAACGGGGGGGGTSTPPPDGGGSVTPVTPPPVTPGPGTAESRSYASWTAPMLDATADLPGLPARTAETFNNQSVRQVMRLSLGGDNIRIKLSNLFGKAPVTFSGVHVAKSSSAVQGGIDTGTDRSVTFGGQASITLAAGTEILSDAVALPVAALESVAVTLYFAAPTSMATMHAVGRQTTFIVPGNQLSAAATAAAPGDLRQAYYGVTAIEASSTQATKVLVAFGDSMMDGLGSTPDANRRFPNQLDDRLKAAGLARTGVVNAGIGGNRWLHDFAGPSGNSRFDRDVLKGSGVTAVLILEGINDIGFAVEPAPSQEVSADQIISAIGAAVAKAKARGLKVFLGTLLPYKGAGYYSESGEAKRQAVNAWIRSGSSVDGVVDFDAALRSASDPRVLNPAYDSGDHLHPNDAGYAAMAAAVDISRL
jgi:lysophospholipase L1-like esterase